MKGTCICGKVSYRCADPIQLVNCHCGLCRRMNGAAFSSYAVVRADTIELVSEPALTAYPVREPATKYFCAACGTPVFNTNPSKYSGLAMFYLGTVEEPADLAPGANIFCDSKLAWVDHLSNQPSFADAPPRAR